MPLQARPLRALICDPDPLSQAAMARTTEAEGFEVVDRTDNAPHLLSLIGHHKPTLIVVANELPGMLGYEVIPMVREPEGRPDDPEVILVAGDGSIRPRALADGAQGVLNRGDVPALERALREVRHFLETGERRAGGDRRAGDDRRQHQDWSKVTMERRSGEDRRTNERRSDADDA